MAESQTSPDAVASQDPGTAGAESQPDAGTQAPTSSDQGNGAASQSQPGNAELDEITRTVSAGGEKAVEIVKHWQRVASEKDSKLAPYKQIENLLTQLGNGDVGKGAEAAQTFLNQYNTVVSHPEARESVQNFLRTGEWKAGKVKQDDPTFDDDFDTPDPTQEKLQHLTREVQELRGGSAVQQMKGYLDGFFNKEMAEGIPLGKLLSDEDKSKIVSGLEGQIKRLASNEAGQQTLRNLNAEMVQQMMQMQLPPEQWVHIGEQAHLQKIERKKGAATGAAPGGGTTGNEDRAYSPDLSTALEEWGRENGVDLWKIPSGR
jgi:hypothetical protein